jgi:hypothetical protein
MWLQKEVGPQIFSLYSLVAVVRSGIRDQVSGIQESKNQDAGSGIPDPQHCLRHQII